MAGRIESSGRQASDDLMARAELLSSGIKSHVEDAERSLTNLVVNTSETIQTGARAAQQSLLTVSSDVGAQLKLTASEVERALAAVGTGAANTVLTSAREVQTTLVAASGDVASQIKSLSADVERTLSAAGSATASTILAGAREVQTTLITASSDAASHVKSLTADVQRSLSLAGTSTAEAITSGAREAQISLVNASSEAASHVKSLAADVQRSLSLAGASTAEAVTAGAREAQTTLIAASSEAANHVKSLAVRCGAQAVACGRRYRRLDPSSAREAQNSLTAASADVERSLSAVGANTAASILSSAREAQNSLTATSADAASQIKAISTDIERSLTSVTAKTTDHIQASAANAQNALIAASSEASSKVKTTSMEIERSVMAATNAFGSAMTGKTDEIVTYVQQQTDRLSQIIDGKRGALVDALTGKTSQLTLDIERVTSDALKSIESRGQAFSHSMIGNGADVARIITSAGELATGAINKSLKDLEQSSRAAIEQSRQVSITAVTEMQETSKILRTDTVALFERLREGNILLQEVLTGAHDNLNSLERALVTRVADFVSAMNDVTMRNGTATQTLEDQLGIFNSKTSKALEDLSSLSSQFDLHGRTLVEAAAMVEQSNQNTTASVADRKAMLDSLVTTIDLRTTDLDQRLSRFTSMLDESLAAAEERARDIARVVAETAGAGSAAISRQFEAVRAASQEEHRQTVETMHDIYRQTTDEADAMFKQSAERFSGLVGSMKQMAAEMHRELEATRNELRRGVLEMPQEAAESTAQMRKVIVDQIEALAELNRIVAQHGRGLDVVSQGRSNTNTSVQRQEEPMLAAASAVATRSACATPAARRTCRRRISACRLRAAPRPRRSVPRLPIPGATAGSPIC